MFRSKEKHSQFYFREGKTGSFRPFSKSAIDYQHASFSLLLYVQPQFFTVFAQLHTVKVQHLLSEMLISLFSKSQVGNI